MAMNQRSKLINELDFSIKENLWESCSEVCFRILYGLSAELQIKLACFITSRYLPIFKTRWSDIKWPEQILDNIEEWEKKFGRSIPEEPEMDNPADASFLFCFDALLLAYYYRSNKTTLTSSCVCAIHSAINARETNVWVADDPQGVEMWKMQGYFPGHSVAENPAAIAVAEREWKEVSEWLKKKKVCAYSDFNNPEEIEKAVTNWREHEMLLIVPR